MSAIINDEEWNPKDEAKEKRPWWKEQPYASQKPDFGYDYDIHAIITQARKLALQEAIEAVEEEAKASHKEMEICHKQDNGQATLVYAGRVAACDSILSKLQGLRGE